MSSPPSTPRTEGYRQTIQRLLATCQRCRRLRRKCDTQLPRCRVCEKASTDCTFYDHALKQTLPRAYVDSLLTRAEHLEAVKNGNAGTPGGGPRPSLDAVSNRSMSHDRPKAEPSGSMPFDVVIPSTSTAGKSRYWGSSSVFALMVETLQHATTKGLVSMDEVDQDEDEDEQGDDALLQTHTTTTWQATEASIRSLVQQYFVSTNTLYGFVDETETETDMHVFLTVRQQPGFSPHLLNGVQAHRFFRITMMCAVSCACQARYRPQRTAECLAYYADAVACVEDVTSEATPASLQALLLLIVFCLFHPRKGDLWKLLDYACRLAVELGYHTDTEPHDADAAFGSGSGVGSATSGMASSNLQAQRQLRRSTFWGLYAIERIVGQLFGRGSDLPESIITVEYPSSLQLQTDMSPTAAAAAATGSESAGISQARLQSMSIAHHYRLVYLRSEIFRSLYLPASPPNLGLDWLKDRHDTLYAWRRELAVNDDLEGVATLTCDVGYDATICFLFQPLLLKALRVTAAADTRRLAEQPLGGMCQDDAPRPVVASDPFYSSIRLIRTYERIIRAPERSPLGSYPMTLLSAHYIHIASSTLLAYALLRLDGRTRTLRRMCDADDWSDHQVETLDWDAFIDVSSSCLILLAWCGERWPGMVAMLHTYQPLFGRVTRELIKKGIVG